MNFKEQLEKDLDVFINSEEFAELKEIYYCGKVYALLVIFERDVDKNRKQSTNDHGEGIFLVDSRIHIKASDFDVKPRQGSSIEIDGESFRIVKVSIELGVVILDLEMFNEW